MSQTLKASTAQAAAERLHSAAIHLLRRVRRYDDAGGVPPAQLSALSVLVFGGPATLGALAAAEHVRPPTMTRIVDALEHAGLVRREASVVDRRSQTVAATAEGRKCVLQGRTRRVEALQTALVQLSSAELRALSGALDLIERSLTRIP